MAEWEQIDMDGYFPTGVYPLITSVGDVAGQVGDFFETIADLLDTWADFLIDDVDPLAAVVDALIQEIRNFLSDFRNANAFLLVDTPRDRHYKGGIEGFIGAVNQSFDDLADAQRPQFTESGGCG